jgi:hypothetical protein
MSHSYGLLHNRVLQRQRTQEIQNEAGDGPDQFDKSAMISVLAVKPYLVMDEEKHLQQGLTYGKMFEISLEDARSLSTYPGTSQPIYRKDVFQTRLQRQIELATQPVTDQEKSPDYLRTLFATFCEDETRLSEREKLILFTYLHIDDGLVCFANREQAVEKMKEMSVESYLIRPSSIADSEGALVRVLTYANRNGKIFHILITHTFGLGYIWFGCDEHNFREFGMLRPQLDNDSLPDNRYISVIQMSPSFPELLKFLSKHAGFSMTSLINGEPE